MNFENSEDELIPINFSSLSGANITVIVGIFYLESEGDMYQEWKWISYFLCNSDLVKELYLNNGYINCR